MEYPENAGMPLLHDSTFLGNEENIPEVFVHGYLEASDNETDKATGALSGLLASVCCC